MSYAIGIDLGGSSIKAVALVPPAGIQQEANMPFDASVRMDWGERIRALVRDVEQRRQAPAAALGLSAPGLASMEARSIANMPGRLQGLVGLDWTAYLERSTPVPVLNDAHAALLGEQGFGAARGFQHVILFTLGTGVGGAAIVDGRLLRGKLGRAGHLGHLSLDPNGTPDVCGTPGSLEEAIGNCSIQRRSNGRFQTTHDLIRSVGADADARRIWLDSVRAFAAAVASCINILDPEAVIIGGGIARAGDLLFDPLREFLDEMEWRPLGERAQILPATLGEFAGAIGAARNALNPGT